MVVGYGSWQLVVVSCGWMVRPQPEGSPGMGGAESPMKNLIVRFVREEEGQDLIEYALLAAFISLAAVLAIQQLGTAVNNVYTKVSATLNAAGS
jgi:pilus assembly protein Flp/PilA